MLTPIRLAFALEGMKFHPFHALNIWWLKRRMRGGVRDGDSSKSVAEKLGPPDRIENGDAGETVWIWQLGQSGAYSAEYSVLIRDDSVAASWYSSHLQTESSS